MVDQTAPLNDLRCYTEATLARVARQSWRSRRSASRLLLENPSTYLLFEEARLRVRFLARVAAKAECGLLLDVNNVMVSAVNLASIGRLCDRFPVELVGAGSTAGYDRATDGDGDRLLIDAHGTTVKPDVIDLYRHTLSRTGPVGTLIEWDNDVPAFEVLLGEAIKADAMLADEARRRNRRAA